MSPRHNPRLRIAAELKPGDRFIEQGNTMEVVDVTTPVAPNPRTILTLFTVGALVLSRHKITVPWDQNIHLVSEETP